MRITTDLNFSVMLKGCEIELEETFYEAQISSDGNFCVSYKLPFAFPLMILFNPTIQLPRNYFCFTYHVLIEAILK